MLDIPTEIFVDDLRRIEGRLASGEVNPEDTLTVEDRDQMWGSGKTYAERAACLKGWIDERYAWDREYAERLRRWIERPIQTLASRHRLIPFDEVMGA